MAVASPTYSDVHKANDALKRMKRDKLVLKWKTSPMEDSVVLGYSNAAYANLSDGRTCGGYLVGIGGASGKHYQSFNVVSGSCRALRRVVGSTMAAETMQLGDMIALRILRGAILVLFFLIFFSFFWKNYIFHYFCK